LVKLNKLNKLAKMAELFKLNMLNRLAGPVAYSNIYLGGLEYTPELSINLTLFKEFDTIRKARGE